jgi:hypothetical protein
MAGEVSLFGRWKLAFAASLIKVPPTQSQALFAWDVAKKCYSKVFIVAWKS